MVNGLTGSHGDLVQSRVVVVANHDQERVPILHQPMVVKTVLEIKLKLENVEQPHVQVQNVSLFELPGSLPERNQSFHGN